MDSRKEERRAKQDCSVQENVDWWNRRKAHCCHNGIFRKQDTIWMDHVPGEDDNDEDDDGDEIGFGDENEEEWARALPIPGFEDEMDDEEDVYINKNPKAGMYAHACVLGRVY